MIPLTPVEKKSAPIYASGLGRSCGDFAADCSKHLLVARLRWWCGGGVNLVVLTTPHALDEHSSERLLQTRLVVTPRPILVVPIPITFRVTTVRAHNSPSFVVELLLSKQKRPEDFKSKGLLRFLKGKVRSGSTRICFYSTVVVIVTPVGFTSPLFNAAPMMICVCI